MVSPHSISQFHIIIMIPFYLCQKLQCSPVIIVADNAKTHRKKPSGRREQFGRSRSEPVITTRNELPGSTGNICNPNQKEGLPKPRPGMCRWNSFTPRSSCTLLINDETTHLDCSIKSNAPKPVRRGSWGKLTLD